MLQDGKTGGLDGLGILNLSDPNYKEKFFNDIQSAIGGLSDAATEINGLFGQTRQRIVEIQTAIADAVPEVRKLGGNFENTVKVIEDAAEASRRNVIITTEQTEKLYAAAKVTGVEVSNLVEGFNDVGVGVGQMSKQIQDSVNYIQSIGGNTKQVFKTVSDNMDQLNRYQFEGGVQGLTKMAAQASMLRFNMNETFRLAEKVLDPEGAIETAAAFQRLGVAAGNLVDPFQLMNLSINDPSGLQDSLANVSKQFTYFDEQTKTFKINPQGVLTLREMEKEAGLTQGSLSKMGLAAAEADKRISAIKGIGRNLSEEDNMLLSNISRMGDGGEYEIKVKDDKGQEYYEKISNISQQQLDATLKEQKEGPKTLEEIQRSQLNFDKLMASDLNAIKDKVVFGTVSPQKVLGEFEGGRQGISTILSELSKSFSTKDVRGVSSDAYGAIVDLVKDLSKGKKEPNIAGAEFLEKIQGLLNRSESGIADALKKSGVNAAEKISDKTAVGGAIKESLEALLKSIGMEPSSLNTQKGAKAEQINSMLYGKDGLNTQLTTAMSKGDMKISWDGPNPKLDVNINNTNPNGAPFTQEQITAMSKALTDKFNEIGFKDWIINVASKGDPTKAPKTASYQ